MVIEKDKGLWVAQVALGIVLAVSLIPAIVSGITAEHRQTLADEALVPTLTEHQYVAFMNKVAAEVDEPAGPPARYYEILRDIDSVPLLMNKFMRYATTGPIREPMAIIQPMMATNTLMEKYNARYGVAFMQRLGAQQPAELNPFGTAPSVPSNTWAWLLYGYSLSVWAAAMFFVVRLRREGYKVRYEALNIVAFAPIWIFKIWTYPSNLDPVESVKRMVRFAVYALSAFLSFGSAGAAFAKATGERSSKSTDGSNTSNTLVLSDIPMPDLTVSFGIQSDKTTGTGVRVHQGAVAWAEATAAYADGVSLDFWSSRALGGDRGSDENDYTLSKSGQAGPMGYTAGIAYFDIQPVGSGEGGDMVSPFLELDVPVGHGVTAFAREDVYLLTDGPKGRGGHLERAGVRDTFQLPGDFTLNASADIGYSEGPFKQTPGFVASGNLSLSKKLWDGLTGTFWVKGSAPVSGGQSIKPDTSAGVSFSYAL